MKQVLPSVVLEGRFVRLEPLADTHILGLQAALTDGELWQIRETLIPTIDEVPAFIEAAKHSHLSGDELTFAIIDKSSGRIVGSTRYLRAMLSHQRVEIGYTFIARSLQGTGINTEAKLLMLDHAFNQWKCRRVGLITDPNNHVSQRAIEKLGAVKEGIMREHMMLRDGYVRDSVIYGILQHEWQQTSVMIRERLYGEMWLEAIE